MIPKLFATRWLLNYCRALNLISKNFRKLENPAVIGQKEAALLPEYEQAPTGQQPNTVFPVGFTLFISDKFRNLSPTKCE